MFRHVEEACGWQTAYLRNRKNIDNDVVKSYESAMATRNRPVYVISIAASLAGCHPRTLRIYEEEGLLEPVRTDTNIRLYSDDDLHRVRVIRYLTQVRGVNLAGVKMLLQFQDVSKLLDELAQGSDEEDGGPAGGVTRF
jgi:MerR family transcriptional regulator/heat shock protein HspR